ncbi:unnamed protein product [Paramecium pentaurelia]|uniref:Uncharacterized protein n=1 Tax=Paramecium pentaurelia TaxID=43138 RepID=A0A8S1VX25_9CILI|nr:unnamed protein product [Paramecium pentaurelia]
MKVLYHLLLTNQLEIQKEQNGIQILLYLKKIHK